MALYRYKDIVQLDAASVSLATGNLKFADFDNDGDKDIIAGVYDYGSPSIGSPLNILINDGNGNYSNPKNALPATLPDYHAPILILEDFTGDGIVDVAAFDAGQLNSTGQYVGNVPYFLKGNGDGSFSQNSLSNGAIHLKNAAAGDIDNEGDLYLYIESGGSSPEQDPYILVNDGQGNFLKDTSKLGAGFITSMQSQSDGSFASFRYTSSKFADMDNDGHLDLILGQLRNKNWWYNSDSYLTYDTLSSIVVYNDGSGNFTDQNAVALPYVGLNDGRTTVSNIDTLDFNSDGLLDLLITHASTSEYDGRYVQALQNTGQLFIDVTADRIGSQETTISTSPSGTNSYAHTNTSLLYDLTGDGHLDLFVPSAASISENAPIFYVNDGNNRFDSANWTTSLETVGGPSGGISFMEDINDDGIQDILFGSPSGAGDLKIYSYLGNQNLNNISVIEASVDVSSTADWISGTAGADNFNSGTGDDFVFGRTGADTLSGGAGNDLIYGNKDADRLVGGGGSDTLFGGQQRDAVFGLLGADQVYGNKQNDTLHGGLGDDSLFGGQQDDLLYGQVGNDRIDGNRGNDTLYGEDGIDTFVISKGDDWVMDFNTAQDKIETADAYSAITQSVLSGNLVLADSDGDTLTLLGVTSTLSEGYFV